MGQERETSWESEPFRFEIIVQTYVCMYVCKYELMRWLIRFIVFIIYMQLTLLNLLQLLGVCFYQRIQKITLRRFEATAGPTTA